MMRLEIKARGYHLTEPDGALSLDENRWRHRPR